MSWMSAEERQIARLQLMEDDRRRAETDARCDWRLLSEAALAERLPDVQVKSVGRPIRTGAFVRIRGSLTSAALKEASWFSLILEEDGGGWQIHEICIKLLDGQNLQA